MLEKLRREKEAAKWVRWRENPALYAKERLGITLWQKQEEIASLIQQHRIVAVQSANGIGKTELAAVLALHYLECHEQCIVLLTGSDWSALEKVLCPRIMGLAIKKKIFPKEFVLQTQIWLTKERYLVSRSTNQPEGVQGFHSANMLIICDETSGVDAAIIDALKGNATGENNHILFLGNPLSASSEFKNICNSTNYPVVSISAFEHPNVVEGSEVIRGAVTRQSIEDKALSWCARCAPNEQGAVQLPWLGSDGWFFPDERFTARVLGLFPSAGANTLIPEALLKSNAGKKLYDTKPTAIGVDVARSIHGDETVVTLCNAEGIIEQICRTGQTLTETAGQVTSLVKRHSINNPVAVDDTGVGGGVTDILRENNIDVNPVLFGASSSDPDHFMNLKAQLHWQFKEALERGFRIPNDERLLRQASSVRKGFSPQGKIRIEGKEEYKKRTGESPDRLESAILAVYALGGQSYGGGYEHYTSAHESSVYGDTKPLWEPGERYRLSGGMFLPDFSSGKFTVSLQND